MSAVNIKIDIVLHYCPPLIIVSPKRCTNHNVYNSKTFLHCPAIN